MFSRRTVASSRGNGSNTLRYDRRRRSPERSSFTRPLAHKAQHQRQTPTPPNQTKPDQTFITAGLVRAAQRAKLCSSALLLLLMSMCCRIVDRCVLRDYRKSAPAPRVCGVEGVRLACAPSAPVLESIIVPCDDAYDALVARCMRVICTAYLDCFSTHTTHTLEK